MRTTGTVKHHPTATRLRGIDHEACRVRCGPGRIRCFICRRIEIQHRRQLPDRQWRLGDRDNHSVNCFSRPGDRGRRLSDLRPGCDAVVVPRRLLRPAVPRGARDPIQRAGQEARVLGILAKPGGDLPCCRIAASSAPGAARPARGAPSAPIIPCFPPAARLVRSVYHESARRPTPPARRLGTLLGRPLWAPRPPLAA
jgi:hypothetical protein